MMKNQIAGLMKQAQKMQDQMRQAQEQLATIDVEGQAGSGLVKIILSCQHEVKRVTIDPSVLGEDKEMLEDLVATAFNDAARKVEQTREAKMSSATAGMPLPAGMKLPF